MEDLVNQLVSVLMGLSVKYPIVMSVVLLVGVLRAINKPLFALARAFADATKSELDNKLIDDVEKSKIYKGVCFVLDWLGSVKLPGTK